MLSRPELVVTVAGAAAEKLGGLAGQYTRTTIELTSASSGRGWGQPTPTTRTVAAWRLLDAAPFEWKGETFDDVHIARESGCFVVGSLKKWTAEGKVGWGWIVADAPAADAFLALDGGEEARCWKFRESACMVVAVI